MIFEGKKVKKKSTSFSRVGRETGDKIFFFRPYRHPDFVKLNAQGYCNLSILLSVRKEYVDALVDYTFNKAVKDQFQAFNEGFHKVTGGRVLVSIFITPPNSLETDM